MPTIYFPAQIIAVCSHRPKITEEKYSHQCNVKNFQERLMPCSPLVSFHPVSGSCLPRGSLGAPSSRVRKIEKPCIIYICFMIQKLCSQDKLKAKMLSFHFSPQVLQQEIEDKIEDKSTRSRVNSCGSQENYFLGHKQPGECSLAKTGNLTPSTFYLLQNELTLQTLVWRKAVTFVAENELTQK